MTTKTLKPVTLKLEEPVTITVDGPDGKSVEKTFTELTLHKLRMRDVIAAEEEENVTMSSMVTFAAMARVPVDVLLELSPDGFEAIGVAAKPLMGKLVNDRIMGQEELTKVIAAEAAKQAGETR